MKRLADRLLHRFTNHETALNAGHHCSQGTDQGTSGLSHRKDHRMHSQGVHLHIHDRYGVMDNGILQVTLSKPGGI